MGVGCARLCATYFACLLERSWVEYVKYTIIGARSFSFSKWKSLYKRRCYYAVGIETNLIRQKCVPRTLIRRAFPIQFIIGGLYVSNEEDFHCKLSWVGCTLLLIQYVIYPVELRYELRIYRLISSSIRIAKNKNQIK